MIRTRFGVLMVLLLGAACSRQDDSLEAVAQRAADAKAGDTLVELASAYQPYRDCVTTALQTRQDINGRLPEMIVEAGLAGSLQEASRRYFGSAVDPMPEDPAARVDVTRSALLAFGRYAAEADQKPEKPMSEQVRRQMAMIEVMQIMAGATSVQCSPPENLLSWMEHANNEYL